MSPNHAALNLREEFTAHLLMVVRRKLAPEDAALAENLVQAGGDASRTAVVLAAALFIHRVGEITQTGRELVPATSFSEAVVPEADRRSLSALLASISNGGPLLAESRSYHSRQVFHRAKGGTFIFLDHCFLDWGVHHFHVYPKDRGRDLLVYAAFDQKCAYLLSLSGHASLHEVVLVAAMSEVCPHLLTLLSGATGDAFSAKEIKTLRKRNVGFVTISPRGAVAPRILCSSGGVPFQVTQDMDREFDRLSKLQRLLEEPAAAEYQSIQQALSTTEPLVLTIVPDEANFFGTLMFFEHVSQKYLRLQYCASASQPAYIQILPINSAKGHY